MSCPDENILLAYCARSLDAAQARLVEAHVDACSTCLALVAEAARGSEPSTLPDARAPERPDTGRPRVPDAELQRGTVLGRYVVIDRVGAGGMGVVLSAYDPQLDRKVALKLVHSIQGTGARELEQRLLREAQAVARLSHPNVITVFDVGTVDGRLFMAMEFVEGRTLRQWIQEQPRTWREVLAAYQQAGQGLAAAHAAHLTHRDFKPDNVLVDRQGRVRVTDFGLARLPDSPQALPADTLPASLTPSAGPVDLTRTGTLMGTPAYMPPEQWQGEPGDARGDQFSFCVALYGALFGVRPFARGQPPDFSRLQAPPRETGVPAWVRRAVVRGLSVSPADRHPSMDALLAELARDPPRRRTQVALGAGALAAVAALTLASRSASDPCGGAPERLAPVWSKARGEGVKQALAATGSPLAEEASDAVVRALEDYARSWEEGYVRTCQATRVRQEQPESVLALRMACLDSRLQSLGVFADVLEHADAPLVAKAAEAAQKLPRVSDCARVESLLAVVPPPEGPGVAAKLSDARARLSRAQVLLETGRYAQGLGDAQAVLAVARELAYRPLEAEALHAIGWFELRLARYAEAEQRWTEGMRAALAGRNDLLAARSEADLVFVTGYELEHADRGLEHAAQARALLERTGPAEEVDAQIEHNLGAVAFGEGLLPQAQQHFQRAAAIRERVLGADHPDTAKSLTNFARVRLRQDAPGEALALYQRVLDIQRKRLGPRHPAVADTLVLMGEVRERLEGPASVVPLYTEALEIRSAMLGDTHLDTLRLHNHLGRLHEAMGTFALARQEHERALALTVQAFGADHVEYALSLEYLAQMEEQQGSLPEALARYAKVLALQERLSGPRSDAVLRVREEQARVLRGTGHAREAAAELEQVLAAREATDGPGHAMLVSSLTELARTYLDLREPRRAREAAERALAIIQPLGWSAVRTAELQFELARARWDAGEDRPQALALADQALATFQQAGPTHHARAEDVLHWKQSRRPAPAAATR
ncbi:tetratricopeptide repeat protein [Corallococcus sp. RDP092CA]|uniref:tetratricopeptide repeat protein n=1 Tax=Corallococcus sp. RDP092CA TaxID=3109369 RepID=UPI0035AFECA0